LTLIKSVYCQATLRTHRNISVWRIISKLSNKSTKNGLSGSMILPPYVGQVMLRFLDC